MVSSGLVGSWFCNCVISRLRKSPKFDDSDVSAIFPACDAALVELLEAAAAKKISAAVADVRDAEARAVNPCSGDCGAHAALLRVFLC